MRWWVLGLVLLGGCPRSPEPAAPPPVEPLVPDIGLDTGPAPDVAQPMRPDLTPGPDAGLQPDARIGLSVEQPGYLRFAPNSSRLSAASRAMLDRLVPLLKGSTGVVRLEGHADRLEKNAAVLSLRRAQRVRDYLVKKGVPARRLRAAGYAATRPLGPGENRRVELSGLPAEY